MGTTRKTTKGESTAPRRARRTSQPAVETSASRIEVVVQERGAELGHDAIALRAYELYAASGYADGNDLQHWLDAEAELRNDARARRS
jgi:hypothetical protein